LYWLSKDPIGIAGGLNQYAFCVNNPVNFTDPFGLTIIVNDTGGPIFVSGNPGAGHGVGGQVFGLLPPGETGGGAANPVSGYPTRGEAAIASGLFDLQGPIRPPQPFTDVDYFDEGCGPKDRGAWKLPGDELGPTVVLGKTPYDQFVIESADGVMGAYRRRILEEILNRINP
jgi:hypothetical protein